MKNMKVLMHGYSSLFFIILLLYSFLHKTFSVHVVGVAHDVTALESEGKERCESDGVVKTSRDLTLVPAPTEIPIVSPERAKDSHLPMELCNTTTE